MAARYGLEIRGATAADAPGLTELMSGAGAAVSASSLVDRIEAVRRTSGAVLLALEWGPPIGVVALSWSPSLSRDAPIACITTLLVAHQARRRGVGRLLLKAASQVARSAGCGVLHMACPPDQSDLQQFCMATGFSPAGAVLERALRKRG